MPPLDGRTILIAEDNYLVGDDLSRFIRRAGGLVLGPMPTASMAMSVAQEKSLAGALLDVRLRDGSASPLAATLSKRGVPFVVISGLGRSAVPANMQDAPWLAKPVSGEAVVDLAAKTFLARGADARPPRPALSSRQLAERLCVELHALTGQGNSPVMLEILEGRLKISGSETKAAAELAQECGWIKLRTYSVTLSPEGRRLAEKPR